MSKYHFITHWHLDATCQEVYRTLEDAESLSRWWPSVYLDVRILAKGKPGGIGKTVALYTKGWLPYTLRWTFEVTQVDFPNGFSLRASGDFVGTGIWTFQPAGPHQCDVVYDWKISAKKPLLRLLSPLLKPLFSANHHWAMRMGAKSLALELQRRRLHTREERDKVPAPQQPSFPHNLLNTNPFRVSAMADTFQKTE